MIWNHCRVHLACLPNQPNTDRHQSIFRYRVCYRLSITDKLASNCRKMSQKKIFPIGFKFFSGTTLGGVLERPRRKKSRGLPGSDGPEGAYVETLTSPPPPPHRASQIANRKVEFVTLPRCITNTPFLVLRLYRNGIHRCSTPIRFLVVI